MNPYGGFANLEAGDYTLPVWQQVVAAPQRYVLIWQQE